MKLVSLTEQQGSGAAAGASSTGGLSFKSTKVTARMLEDFTRSLSSLLAAGIPLSRALVILYKESSSAGSETWKGVHDLVIDGMSLADAMAQFPKVFPRGVRGDGGGGRNGWVLGPWCWGRSRTSSRGRRS